MLDENRTVDTTEADYVEFVSAGTAVVGAYHCAGCGYGVTLRSALPVCPMCAGKTWEQAPWSPFGRAHAEQLQ
jgi:rubrerythrin